MSGDGLLNQVPIQNIVTFLIFNQTSNNFFETPRRILSEILIES